MTNLPKQVRTGRILIVLVVIAGAAAGVVYARGRGGKGDLKFETVAVDKGSIAAKITATGTLSPLKTVQVGSQVSGRLIEVNVDFNAKVTKNQVIARLDPQGFEANVLQAKANYAAARANLAKAEAVARDAARQEARQKALLERQLVSQAEADTALANLESARASVTAARSAIEQSRASLSQAELNLSYTTIVSPIDGVVISRNVDVGQTVAASFQAPTLFTIAEDLTKMQVDTNVAEGDVGRLSPGMPVTFTVDAYSEEKFEGTVRQIRNAAQTVQNVVTYDTVIDVANPALKLKPGMTANVTFIVAHKEDVVRVPNAALRFRPSPELLAKLEKLEKAKAKAEGGADAGATRGDAGAVDSAASPSGRSGRRGKGGAGAEKGGRGARTVWVLDGKLPRAVQVKLGITDGTSTELLEGKLEVGDLLVTETIGGPKKATPARGMGRPF